MLAILTIATTAGWLLLFAALTARRGTTRAADEAPRPGTEPPAVVSVMAGHPDLGYPCTLLDLAARGWLRLNSPADSPVTCFVTEDPPREELTSYERQVYDHVVSRAGPRRDLPARALEDGFAGPATIGTSGPEMKSATASFMERFARDVVDDSRRRGLTLQKLGAGSCFLLWLAALIPAVAAGLALQVYGVHQYWIAAVGFVALCTVAGYAVSCEKLTPAGREALSRWESGCAESGRIPPLREGMPGWPDRQVAYAAALGRARAAVRLFQSRHGKAVRKKMWSGYGGHWREIAIGDPSGRHFGGLLFWLSIALLPPVIAAALVPGGMWRAIAFLLFSCAALAAFRALAKDLLIPGFAEFDGQVIEAWIHTETGPDENSQTSYLPCIAIDDGVRDQAWALTVSPEDYARFTPGTLVHVQVNPRRNRLLAIRPVETAGRG
jgi:hypothetical protein